MNYIGALYRKKSTNIQNDNLMIKQKKVYFLKIKVVTTSIIVLQKKQ